MNIAPCSNRGSDDLRTTPAKAVGAYGPDLLPGASGWFREAEFQVVVCCDCGLTRFFLPAEAIDKVAKSALWEQVGTPH